MKSGSGPVSMGYWEQADLPFYYSLASVFPIADRYFCSVLGQTFPNRRYLLAATSLGMIDDTVPGLTDYPANGTIFDRLHDAGVTWKDYYSLLSVAPTMALFPPLLVKYPSHLAPVADFFADAAAGTLPGFSLVEPNYGVSSEEDPQNITLGEQFAASVVNAVMNGPGWENTLLIWTYDEHGGYYDHVVPPAAIPPDDIPPAAGSGPAYTGFAQYGFRVPCAVVSPYARPDYVSHSVFDHTSICALLETKWNMPALTRRDANANNMLDLLDLGHAPFKKPPALAKPLVDTDPGALLCSVTGPGTIPPARLGLARSVGRARGQAGKGVKIWAAPSAGSGASARAAGTGSPACRLRPRSTAPGAARAACPPPRRPGPRPGGCRSSRP